MAESGATPQLSKMFEKRQVRLRCQQPRSASSVAFSATAFVRGVGPDTYRAERVAELGQPSHCADPPRPSARPLLPSTQTPVLRRPQHPLHRLLLSHKQHPGASSRGGQRETGFPACARRGALGPWPSGQAGAAGLLCPSGVGSPGGSPP